MVVIIPARYASTRLPGKPLADIHGKPMVVRVAERAALSGAAAVWVACDDTRIAEALQKHNTPCLLTGSHHVSGTDRIAEAIDQLALADDAIVVNVQGDEPLIDPQLIRDVAEQLLRDPRADMATLCHPIHDAISFHNPNIVKVVMSQQQHALYFSRAPIPCPRDGLPQSWNDAGVLPIYRHIGLYAYRAGFLRRYTTLPPSPLEQLESLEQLRALWHGHTIRVGISAMPAAPGVDTADDLAHARQHFSHSISSQLES